MKYITWWTSSFSLFRLTLISIYGGENYAEVQLEPFKLFIGFCGVLELLTETYLCRFEVINGTIKTVRHSNVFTDVDLKTSLFLLNYLGMFLVNETNICCYMNHQTVHSGRDRRWSRLMGIKIHQTNFRSYFITFLLRLSLELKNRHPESRFSCKGKWKFLQLNSSNTEQVV